MMDKIVEGTFVAIVMFWVITHASQFGQVTTATRQAVVGSVQTLWG